MTTKNTRLLADKVGQKGRGYPYTPEEEKMLTDMFLEGRSVTVIAGRLGRSKQSVYKKLDAMALRQRRDRTGRQGAFKKKAGVKAALLAEEVEQMAVSVQGGNEEYNEVLGKESAHALAVAFEKVRTAESASDLNTALGAAQKADTLYRKARGIEQGGSIGTINFYMGGRNSSPLRVKDARMEGAKAANERLKDEVTDV
jgi:hypothetical protein